MNMNTMVKTTTLPVHSIIISSAPPSDLVVSSVTTPASAIAGDNAHYFLEN